MPCYDYCSEEPVLNGPQAPSQILSPTGVQSVWSFDNKRDNIEVIK
jgi:hypothetical protein